MGNMLLISHHKLVMVSVDLSVSSDICNGLKSMQL